MTRKRGFRRLESGFSFDPEGRDKLRMYGCQIDRRIEKMEVKKTVGQLR